MTTSVQMTDLSTQGNHFTQSVTIGTYKFYYISCLHHEIALELIITCDFTGACIFIEKCVTARHSKQSTRHVLMSALTTLII